MSPLRRFRRLPPMIRFMAAHGAIGFLIAGVFMAGLLAADPGGMRYLLLSSAGSAWPALVLWFFLGLTFGSVQTGVAIMLLARDDDTPRGGHRMRLVPIPVKVPAGRRPRR